MNFDTKLDELYIDLPEPPPKRDAVRDAMDLFPNSKVMKK